MAQSRSGRVKKHKKGSVTRTCLNDRQVSSLSLLNYIDLSLIYYMLLCPLCRVSRQLGDSNDKSNKQMVEIQEANNLAVEYLNS